MTGRKDATRATRDANDRLLEELPFEDRRDFEDAERGFVAPLPDGGIIKGEDGSDVWNTQRFSFIEEGSQAPDTVNPSLWRQSQLVLKGGSSRSPTACTRSATPISATSRSSRTTRD